MLIDTHAHLNFSAFRDDADEVIRRSLGNEFFAEAKNHRRGREDWVSSRVGKTASQRRAPETEGVWGVERSPEGALERSEREWSDVWMINVGSQLATSKKALKIAEQYEKGVYAAVGLHPIYAKDKFQHEKFKELTRSEKVVAIGEIGLDYKEEYVSFKEKQKEVLKEQINLAKELNLPIIFHCRMAHQDLLEAISSFQLSVFEPKGVIHCFTGTWKQAQRYIEMGLYLGFNGMIFKLDLEEIIKKTPPERILIETDCPYLTPPPETGRNEPLYVKYVAEKIARIKNLSYEEIVKATTQNAKKLFKIKER
jgi:TatD DNase family protein